MGCHTIKNLPQAFLRRVCASLFCQSFSHQASTVWQVASDVSLLVGGDTAARPVSVRRHCVISRNL